MTKWESCVVSQITVRQDEVAGGLFGSRHTPGVRRWEAQITSPSGSQTIYKSEEYQYSYNPRSDPYKQERDREAAYQKLIAYMSSEGWEPAASDKFGHVTLMKRQVMSEAGATGWKCKRCGYFNSGTATCKKCGAKSDVTVTQSNEADHMLTQLERLGQLKTRGLITDEEFKAAKAKLLGL